MKKKRKLYSECGAKEILSSLPWPELPLSKLVAKTCSQEVPVNKNRIESIKSLEKHTKLLKWEILKGGRKELLTLYFKVSNFKTDHSPPTRGQIKAFLLRYLEASRKKVGFLLNRSSFLLKMKLPYVHVCPSIGRSVVGRSVGRSVGLPYFPTRGQREVSSLWRSYWSTRKPEMRALDIPRDRRTNPEVSLAAAVKLVTFTYLLVWV